MNKSVYGTLDHIFMGDRPGRKHGKMLNMNKICGVAFVTGYRRKLAGVVVGVGARGDCRMAGAMTIL